jgi:thiol-disulfide isomerase/thioredoxin
VRGWAAVVCAGLLFGLALHAVEPVKLDSLKVGTRVYRNVTVLGTSETDLYFKHSRGFANVKMKYLDKDLQQRFEYDPKLAEEAERRQIQEDAAYHETVMLELTERDQKRLKAAQAAAASNEDSLADPVSAQSPINKPAPKLEVEKWLAETPETDGKAVLVFFWTTWSVPCRKAIPELNSYQRRFKGKLVVVGLSSQPLGEVEDFTEVKAEFPLAVDTKSKLAGIIGVTSVPYVLLADAKGVVRFVGHPAALDKGKLGKLINPEPSP